MTRPYYVSDEMKAELFRIDELSKAAPRNILLFGPPGCGKTAAFHYFVELSGRQDRWIKMPCSIITDPDEFYGTAEAKKGTTTYHPTEFVEKVETERAAILLDDYGRAISPKVMNGLVGLLDDTARAQYPWSEEDCKGSS